MHKSWNELKFPSTKKVTDIKSTVSRAFSCAMVPHEVDKKKIEETITKLGCDPNQEPICIYCEINKATVWDHLNGMVLDSNPTGYMTVIENLVPACSSCNESKGNDFIKWIRKGQGKNNPRIKFKWEQDQVDKKVEQIEKYNSEFMVSQRVDIQDLCKMNKEFDKKYKEYLRLKNKVYEDLKKADNLAKELKGILSDSRGFIQ